MSNWQVCYQRYQQLRTRWPSICKDLLEEVLHPTSAPQDLVEHMLLNTAGVQPDAVRQLLDEGSEVRKYFDQAEAKGDLSRRLEDVYHAAFYILRRGRSVIRDNTLYKERCYRGQTHTWPLRPKLYRDLPDDRDAAQKEVRRRIREIALFSALLRHFPPSMNSSEAEKVAIAQHYGLRTWLLDFTWDPWIALFFASWNGENGSVGIVTELSIKEAQAFSSGGRNRFGNLWYTELNYVPRVENQKGLFLSGGHEELLEQYVAYQIEFNQHAGLVFEDETLGVTVERLFPNRDVDSFAYFDQPVLENPPPIDYDFPLTGAHYRRLVDSWIVSQPWPALNPEMNERIDELCDFHARLQQYKQKIDTPTRSLHKLADALARICENAKDKQPISELWKIITPYWKEAIGSDQYEWVRRVFDECGS